MALCSNLMPAPPHDLQTPITSHPHKHITAITTSLLNRQFLPASQDHSRQLFKYPKVFHAVAAIPVNINNKPSLDSTPSSVFLLSHTRKILKRIIYTPALMLYLFILRSCDQAFHPRTLRNGSLQGLLWCPQS